MIHHDISPSLEAYVRASPPLATCPDNTSPTLDAYASLPCKGAFLAHCLCLLYLFLYSLYQHVSQSGLSLFSEYRQIFLDTSDTGILPDTVVIRHDTPWHYYISSLPTSPWTFRFTPTPTPSTLHPYLYIQSASWSTAQTWVFLVSEGKHKY
jgi:hypothetical protein